MAMGAPCITATIQSVGTSVGENTVFRADF
jgi:hypothetical protein